MNVPRIRRRRVKWFGVGLMVVRVGCLAAVVVMLSLKTFSNKADFLSGTGHTGNVRKRKRRVMTGTIDLSGTPSRQNMVAELVQLELAFGKDDVRTIRLELFATEAPDAARYIQEITQQKDYSNCNIYRAEPVPAYWGSPNYPDRYFDGGRWGPPYALVQGRLLPTGTTLEPAKAEAHRPIIQRGMVAWAGGKGGPHFFIALADHPEWGHGHTVWAKVFAEDMAQVDEIISLSLRDLVRKAPPNLVYLKEKLPFKLSHHTWIERSHSK